MHRPARHVCLGAALLAVFAAPASALDIHAHRGGGLTRGKPVALENSLSAFKTARKRGADVVELDVHVSKDGVPFVMHDGTLDRTTDCTGNVADRKASELDACHIDLLGTTDVFRAAPGSKEPVPRLAAVLRWAKSSKTRLNVEINHYPNEDGYDPSDRFVTAELDTIDASGIAKKQILFESFLPDNLTPARQRGYRTALITFAGAQGQALALAQQGGFDVLEPQWPVSGAADFVRHAHAAGKRVIPSTIDKRSDILGARAAGVDGIITDDPALTAAVLRQCSAATRAFNSAKKRYDAAVSAAKHAKGKAAKKRAQARVKAELKRLTAARHARDGACAP
jgi:glycerophosphoryl diester phosphodiesterase